MSDAGLRREGNLRFASLRCAGLPPEPESVHAEALELLGRQDSAAAYGPLTIIFDLPPDSPDPAHWTCQIGSALTGTAVPRPPLLIEDYRQLNALVRSHQAAIRELPATVTGLRDEARAHGFQVRPYWRLALVRSRTPDGFRLLTAEVAIFVDR